MQSFDQEVTVRLLSLVTTGFAIRPPYGIQCPAAVVVVSCTKVRKLLPSCLGCLDTVVLQVRGDHSQSNHSTQKIGAQL